MLCCAVVYQSQVVGKLGAEVETSMEGYPEQTWILKSAISSMKVLNRKSTSTTVGTLVSVGVRLRCQHPNSAHGSYGTLKVSQEQQELHILARLSLPREVIEVG